MRRRILIVDEDRAHLASVTDAVNLLAGEEVEAVPAGDGKEIVAAFQDHPVDLVVTGLAMREVDGFAFLSFLGAKYPQLPVVAVTTRPPAESAEWAEKSYISYLVKPFTPRELLDAARHEFSQAAAGRAGFSLAGLLQIASVEQVTCSVRVESEGRVGYFDFRNGALWWVRTKEAAAEEAAIEILSWPQPTVRLLPPQKDRERNIVSPLHLVLHNCLPEEVEASLSGRAPDAVRAAAAAPPAKGGGPESPQNIETAVQPILAKEKVMSLEKHLAPMKEIKGFKAAAIMNYTGEVLAVESVDPNVNLELVGATFNDIFRSAHEASKKIGLDACRETVIITPKGVIIMACSGTSAKVHFHMIGIMAADGNQALLKMNIEKVIPAIMNEL